ncbi:MAG TPA: DNA primase, partial [Galbitalea sp.]
GYVHLLSKMLGIDIGDVRRAVASARSRAARTSAPSTHPEASSRPTAEESQVTDFSLTDLPVDQPTRQERDALMAILQHPADVGRELVERVARVQFVNPTLTIVRDAVATSMGSLESPEWVAAVTAEVPVTYSSLVQQLAVGPIPERQDRMAAYCARVASDLVDRDLLRTKADLLGALQRTDTTAEPDKYRQLQEQLVSVESERRRLRDD